MRSGRNTIFKRNWLAIFCGAVGSQTMYVFMYNYSLIFFTDFLGIAAGTAGTIFFLSRVWDAINDPMCGTLIDRTDTRFGKTQPFMLIGGVVTAIGLILLFTIPDLSLMGRTIWGTAAYNVVGMAFTAVTVSTLVQMPRSSRDAKERVYLSASYAIGCAITGIVVAAFVTKGLAVFGASEPAKGYQMVAIFSAVVGLAFLLGNVFLFRDQESAEEAGNQKEKPKVKEMVYAVVHSRQFLIGVLAFITFNFGAGISSGSMVYYLTYVLGKPEYMQMMLPLLYVGTFAASITAGYFLRFGKIRMCKISMVLFAVGYLGRAVAQDSNVIVMLGLYLLSNLGAGYTVAYLNPILMDCADYTEYKTGIKCEALTLSGCTLCSKMAMGIGTALLGVVLQTAGYNGQAAVQTESALHAINGMYFYTAAGFALLGFVILFFYKLDEKTMAKVREEKEAGKNS